MDLETKVKILKEHGFEECGDRRMKMRIDLRSCSEERKNKIKKMIDKSSFLVRPNEKGELRHWYSEEYIRNTDIEKILKLFNSEENNNLEIEWIDGSSENKKKNAQEEHGKLSDDEIKTASKTLNQIRKEVGLDSIEAGDEYCHKVIQ